MTQIASRELRNNTRSLLERVEHGESVEITVAGRAVARLEPVGHRRRWVPRDEFIAEVLAHQADAGLTRDLRSLVDETTDDLPFA